jgi:hypothetical protein
MTVSFSCALLEITRTFNVFTQSAVSVGSVTPHFGKLNIGSHVRTQGAGLTSLHLFQGGVLQ